MRRGNGYRNSRGRGNGRGGNGRGFRRSGRRSFEGRRPQRGTAQSGNERERIAVESGHLVFIDQFMLANPQFIEKLNQLMDAAPETKDGLIKDYGGGTVHIDPGIYRIERDPYAFSIMIHPERDELEATSIERGECELVGNVFVDTRCLAMIDRELLDDGGLLEKYQQLWFSGQDKACRDLLRDNGGAVRYGFQRHGDELGIYRLPSSQVVCLWPDVAE